MDGMATHTQKVAAGASSVHPLPEDIITEILLRLPSRSVICFRAVCTAWRRILTDPTFLVAHSRLRPAELVLMTRKDPPDPMLAWRQLGQERLPDPVALPDPDEVNATLYRLPVSSGDGDDEAGRLRPRRLISYSHDPGGILALTRNRRNRSCVIVSSCNGVLLLKRPNVSYVLCNPVTRQWAELPPLPVPRIIQAHEYAFYFHEPSGEYRLWLHQRTFTGWTGYLLSTGAAEARSVQLVPEEADPDAAPLHLHGHLYWPPLRRGRLTPNKEVVFTREIVVFDSVTETFQLMAGPPPSNGRIGPNLKLFHMEGMLAAGDLADPMHVNLWFLDADERWECRHRFAMPWSVRALSLSVVMIGDGEGNVIIACDNCFFKYNLGRKKLSPSIALLTEKGKLLNYVYRESLVQQPYFSKRSPDDLRLIHRW